jgi:arylsulfatase A-like enzyme
MKKSMRLVALLMLCLVLDSTSRGAASEGAREPLSVKPNIILLMADDLGWGDVGFNGNKKIKTPSLDAMARAGVVLTRFYSAAPLCSPTRGSSLTGRHPYRYGITGANQGHLKKRELTLAELLGGLGYKSGHFGKWHLGTLSPEFSPKGKARNPEMNYLTPSMSGFDEWFSTEISVSTWDPYDPKNAHTKVFAGDPRALYWHNGKLLSDRPEGDDSRIIMDRAIPFIESSVKEGKPFLAVIWFHAPHKPAIAGPEYRKMYWQYPLNAQHYFGCITALDEQVGRLRAKLRELGVEEDTLLFFSSDNGPEGKERGDGTSWGTTGGFRGRKRSLYEGGVRVPALIEWPGKIAPNQTSSIPLVTSDYLPTIAELVGAEPTDDRPIDGISIASVIEKWGRADLGNENLARNSPIGFQSGHQQSLVDDRYKLITTDGGKSWELYDLLADPFEARDLSGSRVRLVAIMKAQLQEWVESCAESSTGSDYQQAGSRLHR